MPGPRLRATALLATLALAVVLLGRELRRGHGPLQALQARVGRRLSEFDDGEQGTPPGQSGGKCKGQPDPEQQLAGPILDLMCENIRKSGANFLVFGLGRDSPFWYNNTGGTITFLENHEDWVSFQSEDIKKRTHIVRYTTEISRYQTILRDKAKLTELLDSLPQEVRDTRWDVILVDSPMGQKKRGLPGRMQSMYAARELAHGGTVIFVDDYQRTVEEASAAALLAPVAEKSVVLPNGHRGKTAMFVVRAEGPGPYNPPPLTVTEDLTIPQKEPDHSSSREVPYQSSSTLMICKGEPASKQQLRGPILDVMCERIGKNDANFLVFGLGRDSPFWVSNTGGKITFLENHQDWVKFQSPEIRQRTHIVRYTTNIAQYKEILQDEAKLTEFLDSLPQDVRDTRWDVILVDSPMGQLKRGVPGRMQSMYAARKLAHAGTVIFVDDYQRTVETESAAALLAPFSESSQVHSNGHSGQTAMFVMAAGVGQR